MPGPAVHVEVRHGAYHDSVTLMRASSALAAVPGVLAAQAAMATPLNVEVLAGLGLPVPADAGPGDLVVAVRAADGAALDAALARLAEVLAAPSGGTGAVEEPPRTVGAALRRAPADLALVSVPGPAAFAEAMDAVTGGANVMVFSDNVPVAQEIRLKEEAASRGLLVLGPDCGTALVSGVGLGFAHAVAPGPVSLVAASGTGAQQVMALLDAAGVGVRHCLGVGGRDLGAAVAGRSARQALRALAADPGTRHVVVVSKPPDPGVLAVLAADAQALGLPVTWAPLGPGRPDLTAAVEDVLDALGVARPVWPQWAPDEPLPAAPGRALRGLHCGGTLCEEAMVLAAAALGPVRSNIPLDPAWALAVDGSAGWDAGAAHAMVDFGDDALTAGRPHPMIDPSLRLERFAREAADGRVGAVLLDVVLGHGAHPDPAADLAPAIAAARAARPLAVVVALVGTRGDPQGRDRQATALAAAGAHVHLSHAAAARHAVALVAEPDRAHGAEPSPHGPRGRAAGTAGDRGPDPAPTAAQRPLAGLLDRPPSVVAAGVDLLAEGVEAQGADVRRVAWRPPVAAPDALARVLADPRRPKADGLALARMLGAGAELVDVLPAAEALGLERGTFLHAGPPIGWDRTSGPLRGALVGAMLLEGLAADPQDAGRRLAAGAVALDPCHHHGAVGPMAGVVTPSMWGFVLRDPVGGGTAFCTLNEGLGKVLRYGAYGPEVIERLGWTGAVLGPLLQAAVRRRRTPVDVRAIVAQMLQMGDEGHNRNRAGTMLLVRELVPELVELGAPARDVADVLRFVGGNDHFFLNLVMPACKLALDAARDVPGSALVVAMARNGTDFGVQVSGTGDAWFTAPANTPEGLYLGGFGPADANPDIGDSAITETGGIGGFAMAAAPAIVRFVGGEVDDAVATTRRMYEITMAEHPAYQIPALGFRGTPAGIDVTAVVRTGILPQINTGMAGRVAGTGQVGAGLVTPPMACFTRALAALAAAAPPLG